MKYIYIIGILLTITIAVVCLLNQKTSNNENLITATDNAVYTNEEYEYKVVSQIIPELNEFLISDIYTNESDSLDTEKGADYRAFYTNEYNSLIGTIFCADTTHLQDNLNNEMSLQKYADTLHNTQLSNESLPESYDEIISVVDLHKTSLGGREAYSYALGFKLGSNIDTNIYTITENPNGKKCVIQYPISDYKDKYNPKILEMRLKWFNSFEWVGQD